jgi:hypothetical protein
MEGTGAESEYENPAPGVKPSANRDADWGDRALSTLVRDECDGRPRADRVDDEAFS